MTIQIPKEEGFLLRRQHLAKSRRVVVKVGSAVLTAEKGLNLAVIENLAKDIVALRQTGKEVILVSSGAVAAGRKRLDYMARFSNLREKQAIAAVGQSILMRSYEDTFDRLGVKVAQILLTHDDLSHRNRYLNIRNTLMTLLEWSILPIINENDTVSVEELRFGDNDSLGAMITNLTESDLFVCLTDVDGLFTGNPQNDPAARQVHTVARVDKEIEGMAGNVFSALGTGGMRSKILAAKTVSARGGCSFIGSGSQKSTLQHLFRGVEVGTFFLPQKEKIGSRKHWIAYTLRPKGFLVIDDGACRALVERGKSLLPSGIREIRGRFGVGAAVHCLDQNGRAIAAGLVNLPSSDIEEIKGLHSSAIAEVLGNRDCEEIIHRDNMVVFD